MVLSLVLAPGYFRSCQFQTVILTILDNGGRYIAFNGQQTRGTMPDEAVHVATVALQRWTD